MAIVRHMARWGGARLARRLSRSMPIVGAGVALLTFGAVARRKGWLGAAADTALNAVPFVGALKNTAELVRGRDLIPDRRPPGPSNG
jgi:hypothetical protein